MLYQYNDAVKDYLTCASQKIFLTTVIDAIRYFFINLY
jgi:hypothetical protein